MRTLKVAAVALCAALTSCATQTGITRTWNAPSQFVNDTGATTLTTTLKMFVADRNANAVTVYDDAASGNTAPLYSIAGGHTLLSAPSSLGFDSLRQLYVLSNASFAVYPPAARGNARPKYDVGGGLTQISNPQGLAVAPSGITYITNYTGGNNYITAYPAGANGDYPPQQTIYDGSSFFFIPAGIAVHGTLLYVADQGDQSINEYPANANGIVNTVAVINGLNTPVGVAIDKKGLIYVTDSNSVIVYAANANGYAKPLRVISGSNTLMNGAAGLAVHNSEIAVANSGNNSITVYPQNGNGNIAPLRQIVGPNTGLNGPASVGVR